MSIRKKTVLFDFEKGDLAMKSMIVETDTGKIAIKNKIEKLIRSEKELSPIYKDINYGVNKEKIIGKVYECHIREVQSLFKDIKEQILKIEGVNSIVKWSSKKSADQLLIIFEIDTDYGLIGSEVGI